MEQVFATFMLHSFGNTAVGLVSIFTHAWAQHIQTLEILNPLNYLEFLGASKVFLLLSPH